MLPQTLRHSEHYIADIPYIYSMHCPYIGFEYPLALDEAQQMICMHEESVQPPDLVGKILLCLNSSHTTALYKHTMSCIYKKVVH